MAAGYYRMTIEQGATFRQRVVYQNPAGTPVDLTGYTARMMVRAGYTASGSPLVSLTSPSGGITITPLAGQLDLYIADTATALLTPGIAVYDLEIVQGSVGGDVIRLLYGEMVISPEVTH